MGRKKEIIYVKRIETQFPFKLEVRKNYSVIQNKKVYLNEDSCCKIVVDFTKSLSPEDITKLRKHILKSYPEMYTNLSMEQDKSKLIMYVGNGMDLFHPKVSEVSYKILTDMKHALLNCKYYQRKLIIESSGDEGFTVDHDRYIAMLAQFSLFVLYNQDNWDFLY